MSSPSVDSTIADGKNLLHGLCFHQHAAFDQQIVLCSLHLLLLETVIPRFSLTGSDYSTPGLTGSFGMSASSPVRVMTTLSI